MIYKDNRQNKIIIDKSIDREIEKIIEYTACEEGVKIPFEVSLVYTDNEGIKKANNEFRHIDRETDVLSFPMLSYTPHMVFKDEYLNFNFTDEYLDDGMLVLGDIVLSLEKAKEQAEEFNHEFKREACYLVVHSVLHLLGYDHMEDEDKVIMRKREEEILNKFSILR